MKYLHIAVIEQSEECLADNTEEGLRSQVMSALAMSGIPPLSDEEWKDCVNHHTKPASDTEESEDCLTVPHISYYKIPSVLQLSPVAV